MPMTEYSSATKTFSMSCWAMRLPIVARRSPAITTPSAVRSATMVVPWGARPWCPVSDDSVGRRSGWRAARKSTNEDEPVAR